MLQLCKGVCGNAILKGPFFPDNASYITDKVKYQKKEEEGRTERKGKQKFQ